MGGKQISIIILGIVALACIGYAGYQYYRGEPDDAPPLVIAGIACGTLIAALSARKDVEKE